MLRASLLLPTMVSSASLRSSWWGKLISSNRTCTSRVDSLEFVSTGQLRYPMTSWWWDAFVRNFYLLIQFLQRHVSMDCNRVAMLLLIRMICLWILKYWENELINRIIVNLLFQIINGRLVEIFQVIITSTNLRVAVGFRDHLNFLSSDKFFIFIVNFCEK